MVADTERLAQVFLWKQGDAPDTEYARELLRIVNPDADVAISGDSPPLHLFGVAGTWPDDPWAHAINEIEALATLSGERWSDPSRFDLAGWQGKDTRTGEHLFMVTAYRRGATQDEEVGAPASVESNVPLSQTPYQPQYPTGPVDWPPGSSEDPSSVADSSAQNVSAAYYSSRYSPMESGPLDTAPAARPNRLSPDMVSQASLLDSLAPYYVGFGPRLGAMLIDLFFTIVFPIVALAALITRGPRTSVGDQLGQYAFVACLSLLVFATYHVIQIALWGQTLGKALMGIRVVALDGSVPGVGRALVRVFGYGCSSLLAGWGFLMCALDPKRQALHDHLAETVVIPERLRVVVPEGLPGYPRGAPSATGGTKRAARAEQAAPVTGLASVAAAQSYDSAQLRTVPQLPDVTGSEAQVATPAPNVDFTAFSTGPFLALDTHSTSLGPEKRPVLEKARTHFKSGLTELELGSTAGAQGFKVEPLAARVAAAHFKDALELVPNSVIYRYFYAVALRYSEGIEAALREFKRVQELDPAHHEAQQQVTYGARWHDAFAYPEWVLPAPVEVGEELPREIAELLPRGVEAVTRIVYLREGGNKRVAFLSRTPQSAWSTPPSLHMDASLQLMLSRTPHGPILALYVIMNDQMHSPYIGEVFLNPREPVESVEDATQLGQHMLEQLARQDRTYFIFFDENNRLLLSRKVPFNTSTQVNIARILYEVQTLPPQTLEPDRFVQAARWHMEHISLEQIKAQVMGEKAE